MMWILDIDSDRILRCPLLYHPHPKIRCRQALAGLVWAFVLDGGGREGGILEVHDLQSFHKLLINEQSLNQIGLLVMV